MRHRPRRRRARACVARARRRALAGLAAVSHRGAWAADGVTGDGAGLLLPLHATLTGEEGAGIAMCFLREPWLKGIVEEACRAEGPGAVRLAGRPPRRRGSRLDRDGQHAAHRAARAGAVRGARRGAARAPARRRAERIDGIYVASLSFRTVTYKALCAATQLASFYPDLGDPAVGGAVGIFHQRFSTNTEPSWERAQPFRLLCHNGEINTIDGNVEWMEARARARGLKPELAPALDRSGSDSALLDNALELLVRAGLDVREAVTFSPAWQNDPRIDEAERAMHRYHAMLAEPWDGPAGLVYSDGITCGAALDRNGLRPLRVAVSDDGLVAVSSEAGAVPLPEGRTVRRGRLGPGQLLSIDPDRGLLLRRRAEAGARLAEALRHVGRGERSLRRAGGAAAAARGGPRGAARAPRLHARGAEPDAAADRADWPGPRLLDGRRRADSPLAGRARPLASYFRQRFAAGDEPAIDHYRERAVMSISTLIGARAPLDAEGVLPQLVVLPSFLVTPAGLRRSRRPRSTRPSPPARASVPRSSASPTSAWSSQKAARPPSPRTAAGGERAPVLALLAVAAAHGRLVERGLRTACSLLVSSDEARDTHMVATLVGYGADVVCPRLALETVARPPRPTRSAATGPPRPRRRRGCCARSRTAS